MKTFLDKKYCIAMLDVFQGIRYPENVILYSEGENRKGQNVLLRMPQSQISTADRGLIYL